MFLWRRQWVRKIIGSKEENFLCLSAYNWPKKKQNLSKWEFKNHIHIWFENLLCIKYVVYYQDQYFSTLRNINKIRKNY
jgi:hypothetical protein